MAEKKKGRKRKEENVPPGSEKPEKPSKEEYAIAKWLRKNVPTKKTKFLNHNVEYFTAYKAVDALMESHWGISVKENQQPFFTTRVKVIEFLDTMLRHKFFHRAKKIPVSEQELKARKKGGLDKKKDESEKKKEELDKKKDELEEKKKEEIKTGSESEKKTQDEKSDREITSEKKKRKIRLEMALDQCFEDGMDAYVWIYDPVPVYYWFFGTLLVLGAIGVCLFPLWPPSVRKGVYYLSLAAVGFLVLIIGLAVLRLIVFCLVWILTLGKHHLWLLPNLTEDVGVLASFWPLYQYEYKGETKEDKKDLKKKKKKKDKDSDAEDDFVSQNVETVENVENLTSETIKSNENLTHSPVEEDRISEPDIIKSETSEQIIEERRMSESESESSQRSSTGRDFEIVDKDDLDKDDLDSST